MTTTVVAGTADTLVNTIATMMINGAAGIVGTGAVTKAAPAQAIRESSGTIHPDMDIGSRTATRSWWVTLR
jgi:hypothetical protein